MKVFTAILFCLVVTPGISQYFLRGEIKTAQGNSLSYAKIKLRSKGASLFNSGAAGGFGIPLSQKQDTITVMLDGYENLVQPVSVTSFQSLVLIPSKIANDARTVGLMSVTKSIAVARPETTTLFGGETYNSLAENSFVNAIESAETSISLNINCASYSNIRRFLNMESEVPPDGVRIEEMLNYFNLNDIHDSATNDFSINSQLTSCPWNDTNRLFFVNIHAPKIDYKKVPPAKLTFLIDISGSMDKDNRLPLVQSAFKFLVKNLRVQDTVSIVTYGGSVGIALQPTSGAEKQKIISIIDGLRADGDTPGSQAIQTAYQLAEKIYTKGSNNRVILATDGDFNIGQTSDKELEAIVSQYKEKGIYLTCLGTGMGNYKDSRLELLAKKGNGNFAYIDNIGEAQKTMVTEFTKNMYAVSDNTSLHVHFNDKAVKSYRLIGYDNRKDALADTVLMEGGELGSGQSTMAVFEISPSSGSEPLANIRLHYFEPQTHIEKLKEYSAKNNLIPIDSTDSKLRMAAAVCMFGSMLKHSKYATAYTWEKLEQMAQKSCDANNVSEKEFAGLVEKAKRIYKDTDTDKRKRK